MMEPAWHAEIPPKPGLYNMRCKDGETLVAVSSPECWRQKETWFYGPRDSELTPPPPLPEPPKPPRLFRCKRGRHERLGLLFRNGKWRTFCDEGIQALEGCGMERLNHEYEDIEFLDGAPPC